MNNFQITGFYSFTKLDDYRSLKAPLYDKCCSEGIKGSVLLAEEGINGTIAGPPKGVRRVMKHINSDTRLRKLRHKTAFSEFLPFRRTKIRLKKEIVTMGIPGIDPNSNAGTYVKPEDWNQLISEPNVVVFDTRNDYEVEIGSFVNSTHPNINKFRDLPRWISANQSCLTHKKIAMYCTGGIRCEKSTAFMKQLGYEDVYHLKGGILNYLDSIRVEDSLWEGECFVFDERVSVGHGLKIGSHQLCYACGYALNADDIKSKYYQLGVSCGKCFSNYSDNQRAKFAERQKQLELAKVRSKHSKLLDTQT